jgi:hypothetical protein
MNVGPVAKVHAQRRIVMVADHRRVFTTIFQMALPFASLTLGISAAADPATVGQATGPELFIEAALLPQAEDTLAAEVLIHLTPLEEITADTDFRQYMQDGVPADTRREALRKAWVLTGC